MNEKMAEQMAEKKGILGVYGVDWLPVEPDVRKINEKYPPKDMKDGNLIKYEDIEAVVGVTWRENRFRRITEKWRKTLFRDHGIVLRCISGKAYEVASSKAKVEIAESQFKQGCKKLKKSVATVQVADFSKLTQEERDRALLIQNKVASANLVGKIKSRSQYPNILEIKKSG